MYIKVIDSIDQLLQEHEKIKGSFEWLEEKANDVQSAQQLKNVRKRIDSERLTQTSWPIELENEFLRIENQLNDHFTREELMLVECCNRLEDVGLTSTLSRLQDDHDVILGRIKDLRAEVREIGSNNPNQESRYNQKCNSFYISSILHNSLCLTLVRLCQNLVNHFLL